MNYTKGMDLKYFMRKSSGILIALVFIFSFPMISEAALHTYYTDRNSGTTVATGVTTDWASCTNGTSVVTLANQDASGTCNARMEIVGGGVYYEVWYNTAFGVDTTIQGQGSGNLWYVEDRDAGGNCTLSLLYVVPDGTKTVLGSNSLSVADNANVDLDFDMSGVSGDAPSGSKFGFRFECDFRVRAYVGDSNDSTGLLDSGYVTVDESIACTQTGSLSVLSGQSLGGNPIDLTSITNNVNATNVIYSVPEESYSDTEANASSVDTTGWTSGTKTLNLTGDDATCLTPLTPASDTFTYSACPAQSPNDLTAQKGTTQVLLQWTGASCGVNNDTYTVYRDASPLAGCQNLACSAGTMSCTDTSVTGGVTYTYTVRAYNNGTPCEGPDSNAQVVTIPTGFTVTSCSHCHDMPPADGTSRNNPEGAVVGDHGLSSHVPGSARTDCVTCHTIPSSDTDYTHRNGNIDMQSSINGGSYSRGTSFAQGNPLVPVTGTCSDVSCHGGTGSTTPQWGVGTEDCTGCHQFSMTKTLGSGGTIRQVTGAGGDFVRLSRHVSDGSSSEIVTKWDCIVCHREGAEQGANVGRTNATYHNDPDPGGGMVDLRNVDSPTTGWAINNKSMTETMRSNMDTFCLNCHDTDGASGINVNSTDDGLNLDSSRALTPFNTNDTLENGRDSLGSRSSVVNVKTQFDSGTFIWNPGNTNMPVGFTGTNYNGNNSQHAVRGPRYSQPDPDSDGDGGTWTAAAWTNHVTRAGQTMNVTREAAKLHCSDCHLSEINSHGAVNSWHMLNSGTVNDFTEVNNDIAMGGLDAETNPETVVCYKCHSISVYSDVSSTATRSSHNDDGNVWQDSEYGTLVGGDGGGPKLGPVCLNCHAGDGFGNIHGVDGTYDPTNATFPPSGTMYTRQRFIPGAWMQWAPGSNGNDTDWSDTTPTGGTCYFPSSSSFANCTHHGGGSAGGNTPNYARPTTY